MLSKVIFESHGYSVCLTKAGLTVQFRDRGKVMPPTHSQFREWLDAFNNPMDTGESLALCRAFLK